MFRKVLKSIIISLGFSLRVSKPELDKLEFLSFDNNFFKFLYHLFNNLNKSIYVDPMIQIIIFLFFVSSYHKIKDKEDLETTFFQKIVSFILAVTTMLGKGFIEGVDSSSEMLSGTVQTIKVMFIVFAWYQLFELAQKFIIYLVNVIPCSFDNNETNNSKIIQSISKRPFITSLSILLCTWLPLLLLNYPGIIMGDSIRQLAQFYGMLPLRADNPIISTLFMSSFIKLGQAFGNTNFGLFLYSLSQSLILAIIISYAIYWIQKILNNKFVSLTTVVLFGLLPIVNNLINVATKDVLFSAFFLLFIVSLSVAIFDQEYYKNNGVWLVTLFSSLLFILFRKNSLYVAVLSILLYCILFFLKFKDDKIKLLKIPILMLSLGIFLGVTTDNFLISITNSASDTYRREALSLPFQQTARVVRDFDNELSLKDKETIDKVLNYETIKEKYTPRISDKVKATHKEDATNQEMKEYFKLWLKLFFKYPSTYFDATFEQNYSLLYLNKNPNAYYLFLTDALRAGDNKREGYYRDLGLVENEKIRKLQYIKKNFNLLANKFPIVSILNNVSLYVVVLLFVFAMALRKKTLGTIILIVPVFSLLLSLIVGPVVSGYIRYLLPFVLCAPYIFAFFVWENRGKSISPSDTIEHVDM